MSKANCCKPKAPAVKMRVRDGVPEWIIPHLIVPPALKTEIRSASNELRKALRSDPLTQARAAMKSYEAHCREVAKVARSVKMPVDVADAVGALADHLSGFRELVELSDELARRMGGEA